MKQVGGAFAGVLSPSENVRRMSWSPSFAKARTRSLARALPAIVILFPYINCLKSPAVKFMVVGMVAWTVKSMTDGVELSDS